MKKVIYFIIFLLLISFVSASDFSVDVKSVKNVIFKGENVIFDLDITNHANYEDTFFIKSSDLNWILEDNSVISLTLAGKTHGTATLIFKPMKDLGYGNYGIVLSIEGSTSDTDKVLSTAIIDPNKLISFKFLNSEGIDPRREALVKLQIKNNYDIPLNVKYKFTSDLFSGEKVISLNNMEYITEEFDIRLDPATKKGEYEFKFSVYLNNKLVEETTTSLLIKQYSGLIETITPEKSILLNKIYIKKINNGNSVIIDTYTKEFSLLERLFTKSTPEPSSIIKNNNIYIYKWNINLNPKEEIEINVVTDYRTPLLILLVLILIGALAYYKMRRHVDIQKKVLTIKSDGAFTKIKVHLTIKNKTGKNLKNVKIMESLPGSVKGVSDYSVNPNKIVKEGHLTHVIWIIPQLTPNEERIIAYKIASCANRLTLPKAVVKYNVNEKSLMTSSNLVSIKA